MVERPPNKALKLTSLASRGGLGSQLNAVFYAPREGRARDAGRLDSDPPGLDLRRQRRTLVSLSSRSGLALRPCPTRRVTALAARAKRRATPPCSTKQAAHAISETRS
jgi:hypothetical protein